MRIAIGSIILCAGLNPISLQASETPRPTAAWDLVFSGSVQIPASLANFFHRVDFSQSQNILRYQPFFSVLGRRFSPKSFGRLDGDVQEDAIRRAWIIVEKDLNRQAAELIRSVDAAREPAALMRGLALLRRFNASYDIYLDSANQKRAQEAYDRALKQAAFVRAYVLARSIERTRQALDRWARQSSATLIPEIQAHQEHLSLQWPPLPPPPKKRLEEFRAVLRRNQPAAGNAADFSAMQAEWLEWQRPASVSVEMAEDQHPAMIGGLPYNFAPQETEALLASQSAEVRAQAAAHLSRLPPGYRSGRLFARAIKDPETNHNAMQELLPWIEKKRPNIKTLLFVLSAAVATPSPSLKHDYPLLLSRFSERLDAEEGGDQVVAALKNGGPEFARFIADALTQIYDFRSRPRALEVIYRIAGDDRALGALFEARTLFEPALLHWLKEALKIPGIAMEFISSADEELRARLDDFSAPVFLPELKAAAAHPFSFVRIAAARRLIAHVYSREIALLLMPFFNDRDFRVREAFLDGLSGIQGGHVADLVSAVIAEAGSDLWKQDVRIVYLIQSQVMNKTLPERLVRTLLASGDSGLWASGLHALSSMRNQEEAFRLFKDFVRAPSHRGFVKMLLNDSGASPWLASAMSRATLVVMRKPPDVVK